MLGFYALSEQERDCDMRVFSVEGIIVNVDNDCPSVARYISENYEEIPIDLFGDYPQFACNENTVKVRGEWEYRYDSRYNTISMNYVNAKKKREELIESPIKVHGVYWDVDAKGISNMNDAVSVYMYLKSIEDVKPVEDRLPIPSNVNWILSDNTPRVSTYADLRKVLYDFAMRKEYIFISFITWAYGDKLKPFNPDPEGYTT